MIDGIFLSDKVGEAKFINFENLKKVALTDEEKESVAKSLFGHLQEIIDVELSPDGKSLVSVDTLNRIRISDFPNVFNIKQVILQH